MKCSLDYDKPDYLSFCLKGVSGHVICFMLLAEGEISFFSEDPLTKTPTHCGVHTCCVEASDFSIDIFFVHRLLDKLIKKDPMYNHYAEDYCLFLYF
jgi:hypothetical protein